MALAPNVIGLGIDRSITAFVVVAIAALMAWRRGSSLTATEAALYWLGAMLACGYVFSMWLGSTRTAERTIQNFGFLWPATIGGAASLTVTAFFAWWRPGRDDGGVPVAIYWLGFVLVTTAVLAMSGWRAERFTHRNSARSWLRRGSCLIALADAF